MGETLRVQDSIFASLGASLCTPGGNAGRVEPARWKKWGSGMVKGILHVGIATRSIAVTSEFYRLLGLSVDRTEILRREGVKVATLKAGKTAIKLLEPVDDKSPVTRFLDSKGEGVYHIALAVDDLDEMLQKLEKMGVRVLEERLGNEAEAVRMVFIHPHSTGGVLFALCECASEELP
ncbi:MAG TPA: VOC family protein [Acidobacteriota bacterium]|nr:VOC family protein [Acidobacteriota bacterium]